MLKNILMSIVIPCKNESGNFEILTSEIHKAINNQWVYELIFVNDGSTDDSLDLLTKLQLKFSWMRVIHNPKSIGQSFSVLVGARHAKGEWLTILDGDGQNDPADIPRMFVEAQKQWQKNPTEVGLIGHRVNRKDTWVKRMSSRVANGFRGWVLKDNTPDTGCGLKVVRCDVYKNLPCFNHMHRYIPALIQSQGYSMRSFPVNHRQRMQGTSNYGLWNRLGVGLIDVLGVWWLKRRSKAIQSEEVKP